MLAGITIIAQIRRDAGDAGQYHCQGRQGSKGLSSEGRREVRVGVCYQLYQAIGLDGAAFDRCGNVQRIRDAVNESKKRSKEQIDSVNSVRSQRSNEL